MNEKNFERICLDSVDSTNEYAKQKRSEGRNLIVTAKVQTGGRGTKGRAFSSNEGGVYLTCLTFHEDFRAKEAFLLTVNASVSVCRVLRRYGLFPVVKWPNDIHVGGKKICGILIENTLSGQRIFSSLVGIGLNVCNELPKELQAVATTVLAEGVSLTVDEVTDLLIEELSKPKGIEEYRKYLGYMGERATLLLGEKRVTATLLSVTDEGKLQVEIDGQKTLVSAGEVSVRI